MFCSKCGKKNNNNAIYCVSCGNKIIKPTICSNDIKQGSMINPKPKKDKSKFETFVGKNILSILAAILIFIGLITFGVLVFKDLGNLGKTIVMYVVSTLLTGAGVFLVKKNKSSVSSVVLGIGIGSLYISTFISSLILNVFNSIIMLVIMSALTLLTSFMSRLIKNNDFIVVPFIGLVITTLAMIIGSYASSVMLLCLTLFSVLSFYLFLLLGRKEKYFNSILIGYFLVFALICFSSFKFELAACFTSLKAFALYRVISCALIFISIFICVATLIYKTQKNKSMNIVSGVMATFSVTWLIKYFVLDNIMHFFVVISNKDHMVRPFGMNREYFFKHIYGVNRDLFNSIEVFYFILIPIIFFSFLYLVKKVFKIKEELSNITIPFVIIYLIDMLLYLDNFLYSETFFVTLLILLPLLISFILFLKYKNLINNTIYYYLSIILAYITMFSELIIYQQKFSYLSEIQCCTVVVILLGVILTISLYLSKIKTKKWLSNPVLIFSLVSFLWLFIYALLYDLFDSINSSDSFFIYFYFFPISLFIVITAFYTKNYKFKIQGIIFDIIRNFHALFLAFVSIDFLASEYSKPSFLSNLFVLIFTTLILPLLLFIRYDRTLNSSKNKLRSICYSIKMIIYICFVFKLIASAFNTHINQLLISTVFIALFALYILFGFKINNKTFRIFGLIALICSVFKLVVIDMWGESSLIRVGALIVGGLICLATSMFYSKIEKNYAQPQAIPVTVNSNQQIANQSNDINKVEQTNQNKETLVQEESEIEKLRQNVINTYNDSLVTNNEENKEINSNQDI